MRKRRFDSDAKKIWPVNQLGYRIGYENSVYKDDCILSSKVETVYGSTKFLDILLKQKISKIDWLNIQKQKTESYQRNRKWRSKTFVLRVTKKSSSLKMKPQKHEGGFKNKEATKFVVW